jgi:uncharacterized protein (TIGR02757 family)
MFEPGNKPALKNFLEKKVRQYNHPSFIRTDPISVPHRFSKKQDIEIAGLFAAIFAWGNRTTIIRKSNELMELMDEAPYDFMLNHRPRDLKKLLQFKHRTFNSTDLLYFIRYLQSHYQENDSLEPAFISSESPEPVRIAATSGSSKTRLISASSGSSEKTIISPASGKDRMKNGLSSFYTHFFSLKDAPHRTQKHIATPQKNAACKRLNMYLRWMVRQDKNGVDFGLWKKISPADLICPVDLHVARVAKRFGLISRNQADWTTAMELTEALREMDQRDPVKFDFALFGLGVFEKY